MSATPHSDHLGSDTQGDPVNYGKEAATCSSKAQLDNKSRGLHQLRGNKALARNQAMQDLRWGVHSLPATKVVDNHILRSQCHSASYSSEAKFNLQPGSTAPGS